MVQAQERVAGTAESDASNIPAEERAEGGEGEAAQELDPKAENERLKEENRQLEQRAKSAEGSLRTGGDPETLARLEDRVNALTREIRYGQIMQEDIEEPDRAKKLAVLQQETQQENEVQRVTKYAARLSVRINNKLEKAEIGYEDPRVVKMLEKWTSATTTAHLDDIFDEVDTLVEAEREAKTQKARAVGNREQRTMNLGTGGSGRTTGNFDNRAYAERLRKGEPMPPAEDIDRLTRKYLG